MLVHAPSMSWIYTHHGVLSPVVNSTYVHCYVAMLRSNISICIYSRSGVSPLSMIKPGIDIQVTDCSCSNSNPLIFTMFI